MTATQTMVSVSFNLEDRMTLAMELRKGEIVLVSAGRPG